MKAGIESRRFRAEETIEPHQSGSWGSSLIKIFDGPAQVGEYKRNHPGWAKTTFEPFELGSEWYALYSRDYTSTRVMKLPDCADLGGEEPAAGGFCPVEFYVPRYKKVVCKDPTGREREDWWFETDAEGHSGQEADQYGYHRTFGPWLSLTTGFVAGCVWGDDSTWKLEVIDLSRAAEGVISRSDRFGHLQLANGTSLADSIRLDRYMPHWELRATVIRQERRDVATGQLIDPYNE
ncbi:hypothetical protein [Inquilinus sp. OTU3971]|uniref:hypothetical protein n=1 Tax=Inquilinus sp. OTU3971 TaxID=3043855 RepID=UPI00313C1AFC